MELIFWWILLIWLSGILGYWVVRYFLSLRKKNSHAIVDATPIAHGSRLFNLPAYQSALKQYKILLYLSVALLTISLVSSLILTARPARLSVIEPVEQSRDIMLCLDVSGSMLRVDANIVNRFIELAKHFDGQRIGLVVFNSSPVLAMPLSDDYSFIHEQLTKTSNALRKQKGQDFTNLTSGTLAGFDDGTSLVGDGLVSCINSLGSNPQKRSQSILLATDNEVNGTPIITLKQSIALAQEANIRLYAIDPGPQDGEKSDNHDALKSAIEDTGGGYFQLDNTRTISSIISLISSQEEKYGATAPTVVLNDEPRLLLIISAITGLASLVVLWRLRL